MNQTEYQQLKNLQKKYEDKASKEIDEVLIMMANKTLSPEVRRRKEYDSALYSEFAQHIQQTLKDIELVAPNGRRMHNES